MNPITISAIIPTRGNRPESLEKLKGELQSQIVPPDEIIVIEGLPNPGAARNLGAGQAKGEIFLFLDDDASLDGQNVIAQLYETLSTSPDIGLAGAAIAVPHEANSFQKAYARQFPRSDLTPPLEITDSDLATTLCCMIPAQLFRELGGFRDDIEAGEDPELRDRIRQLRLRTVLAPKAKVFHPPPLNLREAFQRSFWYGKGDAQVKKLIPAESWRHSSMPIGFGRLVLKAATLPLALLIDFTELSGGNLRLRWGWIYVLCGYAHLLGYIRGRLAR